MICTNKVAPLLLFAVLRSTIFSARSFNNFPTFWPRSCSSVNIFARFLRGIMWNVDHSGSMFGKQSFPGNAAPALPASLLN
ncbi:hypothetical protein GE09DRAFT_1096094, partial [Coniochaeta sp. 2T2.1]